MDSLLAAAAMALWLGIMTSISPCPLATNIAAISFMTKRVGSRSSTIWTGICYVIGRLITYVVIAIIVVTGILSIPRVSFFLQRYMNAVLGPLLIVVGLVLLEWLPLNLPGLTSTSGLQERVSKKSLWGASFLGALFALSFCPVSAALFFGSLIPLSVQQESYVLLPTIYGIGTGLPVIAFGLVVALSAGSVGKLFNKVMCFERWLRRITAIIFFIVGIHFVLRYIFDLY